MVKLYKKYVINSLLVPALLILGNTSALSQDAVPGQYLIKYNDQLEPVYADAISAAVGFNSIEVLDQNEILLGKEDKRQPLDKQTIKELLAAVNIDGRRRAETLTLSEWLDLHNNL